MRHYRVTLVTCALSWFLLGMHFDVVHQLTVHGLPRWPVLVATLVLAILAVTSLSLLLRAPAARPAQVDGEV